MLGIIASTEIETGLIIRQLKEKKGLSAQRKSFYKGILKQDTKVVICICGIGKANAAHGATLLIEKFKPNLVYIIGVGGAYPSSGLNIGDIAIAEKEIYGDEGLRAKSEDGKEVEEIIYTMDKLKLPLATINGNNFYNEFPIFMPERLRDFKNKGNFVTVSACTGTLKMGKEIEKRFNALCENMEGAAIAQICALSGVQAAEIRGISNVIEDRLGPINKSDIVKAAKNAQVFFLERLI